LIYAYWHLYFLYIRIDTMKTIRIYSIADMARLFGIGRIMIERYLDANRGFNPSFHDGTGRRYFSKRRALQYHKEYTEQKAAGRRRILFGYKLKPGPKKPRRIIPGK